mmetsp:Transcript_14419/g.20042  ORF Transcript_14419/g.20042 Transcript_14419/m.20042 type:complete len:91 (+) Transcript_14419:900-1172(+)
MGQDRRISPLHTPIGIRRRANTFINIVVSNNSNNNDDDGDDDEMGQASHHACFRTFPLFFFQLIIERGGSAPDLALLLFTYFHAQSSSSS